MTSTISKPDLRPACPLFSSGPTAKRPGFSLAQLETAALGRSQDALAQLGITGVYRNEQVVFQYILKKRSQGGACFIGS